MGNHGSAAAAFLVLALLLTLSPVILTDDSDADIIIHSDIPEEAGYEEWMFIVAAIVAIPLGVFIGLVIAFKILFKGRD